MHCNIVHYPSFGEAPLEALKHGFRKTDAQFIEKAKSEVKLAKDWVHYNPMNISAPAQWVHGRLCVDSQRFAACGLVGRLSGVAGA